MEYMINFIKYICYETNDRPLRWRSGLERNSCGRLGVQIRAATDLSRVSSTAKRSEIGVRVTLPRRWQTSLLNGHEYRAWVIICSPSPVMVTSPNEWKILEWYEKHRQTNKQTNDNGVGWISIPVEVWIDSVGLGVRQCNLHMCAWTPPHLSPDIISKEVYMQESFKFQKKKYQFSSRFWFVFFWFSFGLVFFCLSVPS